jgi:hypothetical protein
MKNFQKVYILLGHRNDALPLYINYEQHDINWIELDEFAKGICPMKDYKIANFIIKKPKKMICDFYNGFCNGMVSKRLLDQTEIFNNYRKFPVQINGEDFFALIIDKETDCFDRANSVFVTFDDNDDILSIAEYTFFINKVDVEKVFSIPEYNYMYCTDIVKDEIEKRTALGFTFLEIFDVTTGRVHI